MLQPALLRALGLNPGLMAAQPQQREVLVGLARHDRLEVELDVGLARERDVVAQQPQRKAVGDDAPQAFGGAVEQLLDEAVRGLLGGAAHPGGAPIERHAGTNKVNRRMLILGEDRVRPAVQVDGGVLNDAAVAEFGQQRQLPALACQLAGLVAGRQLVALGGENLPSASQARPGPGDRLADPLASCEVVGVRRQAAKPTVEVGDPRKHIAGQQPPF